MKLFSKFKQFSREIKLIIITALIVSCVGVYAAGECVISATADDVTYNNTTVQSAIDELYSMSESCPEGYECTRSLYSIMASNSVLDDRASTYVSSSSGINFSQISSDTNGKGIYEIASTKNDTHPIYYYRGAVNNNNAKFGGFCWKIVRTTDTGGVKLIYNGEPDGNGNCTITTGTSTQIGTGVFNSSDNSPADVGYMYGTRYEYLQRRSSLLNTAYFYGHDVTYSNGTYTLTNTMTSTGTWSTDYTTLNNNHYTCFSSGTTCTSVYYVYYTSTSYAYYIKLTNGNKVEDALNEMFINSTNSAAKTQIDNWYNENLLSYTNYIEDTIYCNDRSISDLGGWDPVGGDTNNSLYFNPYIRINTNYTPTLTCTRALDRFTVSSINGNGKLTYPIGLLSGDEVVYAGGKFVEANNLYYLYTNQNYWLVSSFIFSWGVAYNSEVSPQGSINNTSNNDNLGIRPVISLKSTVIVSSGDGTSTNPYVIKTS